MPTLHEMNQHTPTDVLVTRALDEVRRLCLGPNQRGGRRWTMCVPVQVDDSDIAIVDALRRQRDDIARMHEEAGALHVQLNEQMNDNVRLRSQVEQATARQARAEDTLQRACRLFADHKLPPCMSYELVERLGAMLAREASSVAKAPDAT